MHLSLLSAVLCTRYAEAPNRNEQTAEVARTTSKLFWIFLPEMIDQLKELSNGGIEAAAAMTPLDRSVVGDSAAVCAMAQRRVAPVVRE